MFEVNKNVKEYAVRVSDIGNSINTITGSLTSVSKSLQGMDSVSLKAVAVALDLRKASLSDCGKKIDAAGKGLQSIYRTYFSTETKIASALPGLTIPGILPTTGTKINDRRFASDAEKNKTISDFEKSHPEDAKKVNEFLNTGKNNKLTADDIREIKYLAYTAEEPYRSIFLASLMKFTIGDGDMKEGAYYKPWKHTVNYSYPDSYSKDPRGPYTTFFHEYGHGVDDMTDHSKWLGADTEKYKTHSSAMGKDVTIREAIEYDIYYNKNNKHSMTSIAENIKANGGSGSKGNVDNVIAALKKGDPSKLGKEDLKLYNSVCQEHYKSLSGKAENYEAVTDVYGGMSKNVLRGKEITYTDKSGKTQTGRSGYGHDTNYWNDKDNPGKELWAEYYSYNMAGDDVALRNLREYFPEASNVLDQYANDIGRTS